VAAALWLLAPAIGATAAERAHRAAPGEDLAAVSLAVYGDARWADLIASYNALQGPPATGARLKIPSAVEHRVKAGESWSKLAKTHWGNGALGPVLALFAGHPDQSRPPVGKKLVVPALVRYRIRAGESLAKLARRFYGDVDYAEPLAQLNRPLDPRRLAVGTPVRLPLLALARSSEREPEPEPPADPPPSAPPAAPEPAARADVAAAPPAPSFEIELRQALNAYLDGDYAGARQQLEALRAPVLAQGSPAERSTLLRHLVFAYVAFDQTAHACAAHAALREVEPELRWDPDATSPKVLEVLDTCE
jgi:LysM repeat protein